MAPMPQLVEETHAGDENAQAETTAENLRNQVAAQLQVATNAVEIVAVDPVEWPDACLCAAGPDEQCAQVVTPGYVITLAVGDTRYVYHTDRGPYWLRLVDGPTADVGVPVISGQVKMDNGSCQDVLIGPDGVAFGSCGGALMGGKFVSPARRMALDDWAAHYAPFEAENEMGVIRFAGHGTDTAPVDTQRHLVNWTQLVVMEAAAGQPMGGLFWAGPAETEKTDAPACANLALNGNEATLTNCDGEIVSITLEEGRLARWQQVQDRFAPMTVDTGTEQLDFTGLGTHTGEVWQRALLAWARTQYAELHAGAVTSAGNTIVAWDLGVDGNNASNCRHLTVLAWGEAYAETRPCADGPVLEITTDWLTTAELEQLDSWRTAYTTVEAEQGYMAGTGSATAGDADLAAMDQWAVAVWTRIAAVDSMDQPAAGDAGDGCPRPTADGQLLVNTEDGYCLLYPHAYVAEPTAPGNVSLVMGSVMNHTDPRVGIEVTDVDGRTLAEIGDQLVADFADFEVVPAPIMVDGQEALMFDRLPGQDLNRRVVVIHNG
ncbi:MAG: hypothetical protein KDD78_04860, partial [Caldilineaceae bacterium]|nr:hypothetical protein [Caldilineaceae bacterium]